MGTKKTTATVICTLNQRIDIGAAFFLIPATPSGKCSITELNYDQMARLIGTSAQLPNQFFKHAVVIKVSYQSASKHRSVNLKITWNKKDRVNRVHITGVCSSNQGRNVVNYLIDQLRQGQEHLSNEKVIRKRIGSCIGDSIPIGERLRQLQGATIWRPDLAIDQFRMVMYNYYFDLGRAVNRLELAKHLHRRNGFYANHYNAFEKDIKVRIPVMVMGQKKFHSFMIQKTGNIMHSCPCQESLHTARQALVDAVEQFAQ